MTSPQPLSSVRLVKSPPFHDVGTTGQKTPLKMAERIGRISHLIMALLYQISMAFQSLVHYISRIIADNKTTITTSSLKVSNHSKI